MKKAILCGILLLWVGLCLGRLDAIASVLKAPQNPMVQEAQLQNDDDEFHPGLGVYHYKIAWGRGDIAEAWIAVDKEQDLYLVSVKAKTKNLIEKMFKVRYRGEGKISAEDLAPVHTYFEEKMRSKRRETTIVFNPNGTVDSVRITEKKGKDTETDKRQLEAADFALDPITAIFMVRNLDWELGESDNLEVFTGKTRYLLTLSCQGKTTVKRENQDREVWVITIKVQNLDEPQKKSKVKQTIVLLTTDQKKDVLYIKSSTKFGAVTAELMGFVPK